MTIHFIGIGGIGVSALAKYYLSQGARVSGSDLASSEITEELKNLGVKVFIGRHKKSNIPKHTAKVIYTAAVTKDNPELKAAFELAVSYPEAVGELTKKYETITVSGSHGKSTTTALIALVLEEGYFDPTVLIGTKVKEFGNSNFRQGRGRHLVLEADEWNRSFHNYFPKIAVVTNIDAEHLDTYRNAEAVKKAFEKYLSRVPRDGAIVANYDDPRTRKVARKFGKRVYGYSLSDWDAPLIRKTLKIPGEHNVSNALAAARVGRLLGIKEGHILSALSRFSGCWRRFEWKGLLNSVRGGVSNGVNGAHVFSDYGHHPTEIKATIAAARERFPFRRVWCVYQPHQYQRLRYLWKDFIPAFDLADRVSLLPVYNVAGREHMRSAHIRDKRGQTRQAGRDAELPGNVNVSSEKLMRELLKRGKNASYHRSQDEIKNFILTNSRPGDIVLIMGAGDIYTLADKIICDTIQI